MSSQNQFDELIESEDVFGVEFIDTNIPFNPNDINISIVPRNIGQLVEMLEYDEILIPKYQRLPNLWDIRKKSRFIESLMLSLPIPLFYFDEGADKLWRVIDGLQRISTLEHFILAGDKDVTLSKNKESFRLQDLEFRTEFNGLTWDELPKDIQRRISRNQVTINLIGKGTPDQVKFNIFSRINQAGVELKAQEIRTALFQGYRIEFLEKMVQVSDESGNLFHKATDNSVGNKRQEDLDFISRFVSFYLLGYTNYDRDMDSFLTSGTKKIPVEKSDQSVIIKDFANAMKLAYEIFGKFAFRKLSLLDEKRKAINKPLFEIVSVSFAKLTTTKREHILKNRSIFLQRYKDLLFEDKFFDSITTGTASKERVKYRHEEFGKLVNSI